MVKKNQIQYDIFSSKLDAEARGNELGLGYTSHVYEVDGQAYYMPGSSHEEYLSAYETEYTDTTNYFQEAVSTIIREVMSLQGQILKSDDEQRIVYGWASVVAENGSPVVDRQGDSITPEVMTKAVNEFMEDVRVGKAMHEGDRIGTFIHSLPLTNEIAKALGIETQREGWVVALKVHDDETWERVKSGELKAFSIGGRAKREKINE